MMQTPHFCQQGLSVIEIEAAAIQALASRLDEKFDQACQTLLACQGRIIVTGIGKSGHIGQKIAATLASTGSPAFFVHAAEASHGDMGMITRKDVVIAVSNSGNNQEINTLLPLIKRLQIPLISLTGNPTSNLANHAHINLDVSVDQEACPLGLAPTASTTAALVMGDALAITLLQARGFSINDFAFSHPGGTLGKRLLVHCNDIMHKGDALPKVNDNALLRDALLEISAKKLGMTCVVDDQGKLLGIFTDGDLRRSLEKNIDINHAIIKNLMQTHCKTIQHNTLAVEALNAMEHYKITTLVVVDGDHQPLGVVHMHDLLQAGVI